MAGDTFDKSVGLTRRSALSERELGPILANCDANQRSMYFCAFRDAVTADVALRRAVEDRKRDEPGCASRLAQLIGGFERSRDAQCAKSASEDFEGGSMEATALAMCNAASTNAMVEQVGRLECSR